jgi:hypothetical protein
MTPHSRIHELNYILLLDYKFTLHTYEINYTRLVGMEVSATEK